MKKLALLSAIAISALTFASCEKAAKLLFKPFESPLNFDVTVPVVSTTAVESSLGNTTVNYNLDEEVKKNTGGEFGSGIVGAMYINQIAVTLSNTNGTNNLSNFEYVTLSVSSGGSSTPVVFGPFNVTTGATTNALFTVTNSPNIKPFFNGANVNFELRGKAKNETTQTLPARISATIKFDK